MTLFKKAMLVLTITNKPPSKLLLKEVYFPRLSKMIFTFYRLDTPYQSLVFKKKEENGITQINHYLNTYLLYRKQ